MYGLSLVAEQRKGMNPALFQSGGRTMGVVVIRWETYTSRYTLGRVRWGWSLGRWGRSLYAGVRTASCLCVARVSPGAIGLTRAVGWFGFDFGHRAPRGYEASSLCMFVEAGGTSNRVSFA